MTTVEELQKWDENFYTGTVGGPKFLAQQLERGKLNDGKLLTYAFGLEVTEYRGLPIVEHSGSTGGYRTDITRFPGEHTSVVTMCNVSAANSVGLAHAVADIVLAPKFTKPVATAGQRAAGQQGSSAPISVDAAALGQLTGRFYSEELSAFYELSAGTNALVLKRAHAGPDTLRATEPRVFRGAGLVLRFDAASPAKGFTVENGRARGLEFVRTP
jgi:hypothetical protein